MFSLGLDSLFLDVWRPPEAFFACGLSFVACWCIWGQFYWTSSAQTAGVWNQGSAKEPGSCEGGPAERPRPKSGLWTVTVQFVFGSPLVAELRSEPKVKTHGEGQQDQRTTTHTAGKGGKRQWELVRGIELNKQSSAIACTLLSHNLHCMGAWKRKLLKATVGFS